MSNFAVSARDATYARDLKIFDFLPVAGKPVFHLAEAEAAIVECGGTGCAGTGADRGTGAADVMIPTDARSDGEI